MKKYQTKEFDLSSQYLDTLPKFMCRFRKLQILNLSHNNLQSVPDVLFTMVTLIDLNIAFNKLATLPEDFLPVLNNLKVLNASYNNIWSIPKGVNNTRLRLNLSNNPINQINITCEDLDISNTNIELNPTGLNLSSFNPHLTGLNVSFNPHLTHFCYKSKYLHYLDLSHNYICSIKAIGNFPNLQVLNLSYNALDDLSGYDRQSNISELYLNNNNIRLIPKDIINLRNLKILHLQHNFLTSLPRLPPVKILRIDHNEITEFTCDFPGLEILIDDNRDIHTIDISDSGLAHVPHWVLQHPHLKHLYLDNNYICNIACLNILTELETLGLSNNHILHVPDNLVHLKHVYADTNHMNRFNNFTQFEQVEHLNLSDNELTDAVCLAQFQKLKILELDHNQITRIEDIYMCHALQELYLHDNQLLDLPEELPPKLRDFTWYNNPFSKSIHF